jgi:dienelactone hydrolase
VAVLFSVDAGRIGAIGYCFGGRCVLELARSGAPVRAVVSFHGVLSTRQPAEPGAVRPTVAVYTGALDPYAPPDHVRAFDDEMRAAGADHHLTVFANGYHAFTDPTPPTDVGPGLRHDPLLAALSWTGATTLLAHTLT